MVLMKEQSISLTSVKKFPQYYDFFGLLLQFPHFQTLSKAVLQSISLLVGIVFV